MEYIATIVNPETYQKMINIVGPWLLNHGLPILAVLVGAYVVSKFSKILIEKAVRKAIVGDRYSSPEAEEKREDTLIQVSVGTLKVIIWIIAVLMILSELGIEIGPVIAAAGIVGVAVGFGAQYLIRDVIAGLFIILENQYRVGDAVNLEGTSGSVEEITLRKTIIRDKRWRRLPHS